MKVTSIEIHPAGSSEIAVLSFRDPRRANRFNVKGIFGLDADEILPRYYGVSGTSNDKFYSLALMKRDITFQIELNPRFDGETYTDLRGILQKMISSSRTGLVEVQFKNGTFIEAAVSGFVSKFESPMMDKVPTVQITISCKDPMLKAPAPVEIDVESIIPWETIVADDLSTAPHGFSFQMLFSYPLDRFLMYDPDDSGWSFEITPVGGFLDNDLLIFSSELNNKKIQVLRGGVTIHLADVVRSGSIWPILFPGENKFSCENPSSLDWYLITHYPTYWGV